MNIINERQQERRNRINMMIESVKKAKNPDYHKLWLLCAKEWGISKRYFNELMEVVKADLDLDSEPNQMTLS